jgi:ribosomal protein L11 methyltransferase
MKRKPLWRISVATTREAEDAVMEMLGAVLQLPVSSYFNVEKAVSTVSAFSDARFRPEIREALAGGLKKIENCGLKIGTGGISIAKIQREDWAESWKRHFKPINIGNSLLIKPSWSRKRPRVNQKMVVLDPGLSFGTGQHPTTAFCLREIVRYRQLRTRNSFLDIGTGSGILAIAAVKLEFFPVDAFDFDADAVKIARVNAQKNGVARKIHLWRGDAAKLPLHPLRRYDLICANLISTLLIAQKKRIVAQLYHGGRLVLAGILKSEFTAVEKSFGELGLQLVAAKTEKEWRSGTFRFA